MRGRGFLPSDGSRGAGRVDEAGVDVAGCRVRQRAWGRCLVRDRVWVGVVDEVEVACDVKEELAAGSVIESWFLLCTRWVETTLSKTKEGLSFRGRRNERKETT